MSKAKSMGANTLTVTEMSRKFADYMNRVKYRGESFILTKGNEPFAEIRPLPRGVSGAEFSQIMNSKPRLTADEAEAFAKDVYEGIEAMNKMPVRNPWED